MREKAYFHLPGLFEFYELYRMFLPLFREHREYFYDWCEIGSIYGAPADCIWGGGRAGFGENDPEEVLELMQEYGISARLTFSNSLLRQEHLSDRKRMGIMSVLRCSTLIGVAMAMSATAIRFDECEKDWIQSYASVLGISFSEFVRSAALEKVEEAADIKAYN